MTKSQDQKEKVRRKDGQSTVEYLLVTLLASILVLIFAVQLSPGLKSSLEQLEDLLVAKIQGGKLLTHAKVEELPVGGEIPTGGGVSSESSNGGALEEPSQKLSDGETSLASGGTSGASGVSGGGGDASFLKPGEQKETKSEVTSDALEEGGLSSESVVGGGVEGVAGSSARGKELKKEKGAEKSEEKIEKESETKGVRYGEGEEETLFERGGFDWMKILVVILIIIVGVYILFEIYKATKLGRSK